MRTRAQGTRRAGHARTQHGAACRGQGRPRLPHPRFPRPAAPLRFGRKSRTRQTWARPPARRVIPRARRHTCRCCRALRPPSRQRALKKTAPQPMVLGRISNGRPPPPTKHARRVLPRARRHTCRCCRALRPPSRQRALKTSGAAESPRGASSPAHAAYTPMMPLLCRVLQSSVPLAPAGAEKVHAAADGSGAYQIVDRRRSAKHARRVLPRARRHTCRCCRALRPPSRQRALKKHMPQPMVRAHIKWPTAAAQSTRGASSPRARRHTRRCCRFCAACCNPPALHASGR